MVDSKVLGLGYRRIVAYLECRSSVDVEFVVAICWQLVVVAACSFGHRRPWLAACDADRELGLAFVGYLFVVFHPAGFSADCKVASFACRLG